MIYMPYVANVVAIGIVWSIVLNPFEGPINSLLRLARNPGGLPAAVAAGGEAPCPPWRGSRSGRTSRFRPSCSSPPCRKSRASCTSAPRSTGPGGGAGSVRITLPMISPTTFFLVVITVIGSFNSFSIVKALTDGGPGHATRIITVFIYEQSMKYSYYSYANALACLLFIFILIVTLVQWKAQEKWVQS